MTDTVFFTTGDAQFDLKAHLDGGHPFQEGLAGREVVFNGFFGQIQHVGAVKCLASFGIGLFAPFQHFIDPWHKLAVCVVGMHDNSNTVMLGQKLCMTRSRYGAENTGRSSVLDALAGKELCTTIRKLNDNVRSGICSSLKGSVHRA